MAKRIIVVVPRKGISQGKAQVSYETTGFVGAACQRETSFLEAMGKVVEDTPTAELYANEENVERLKEGNGE